MSIGRHSDARARLVMWSGIALAALVLAGLLARGWGRDAWGTAAGVLLLACVASCGYAVLAGRRADREVRDEIERWLETRRRG